jgi:hypothetical protein
MKYGLTPCNRQVAYVHVVPAVTSLKYNGQEMHAGLIMYPSCHLVVKSIEDTQYRHRRHQNLLFVHTN